MRSGPTPNFPLTPSTSSVSFDIVLISVTCGSTSCARSLSPVETIVRIPARSASLRERADDVVGLDAVDHEQRPAQRADRREERLDLRAEVVGHRRAVRLVLGVDVVAKGLALGVEDAAEEICLVIGDQPP